MARIKRSLKTEFDKKLSDGMKKMSKQELMQVGEEILEQILDDVSKGVSPIKGRGRFPRYKDTDKYPGDKNSETRKKFPNKRSRPVNLWLSGDFLSNLEAFTKSNWRKDIFGRLGYSLFVGFRDQLSKLKEKGHRDGVNGQPERPIIPEGNEEFSKKYLLRLKDGIAKVLNKKLAK